MADIKPALSRVGCPAGESTEHTCFALVLNAVLAAGLSMLTTRECLKRLRLAIAQNYAYTWLSWLALNIVYSPLQVCLNIAAR